jgi:hypothetical protein
MGCLVGKKYTPPSTPTDISYRDTVFTDTTQLMRWFELYHDPVLLKMIHATLDRQVEEKLERKPKKLLAESRVESLMHMPY